MRVLSVRWAEGATEPIAEQWGLPEWPGQGWPQAITE